MKPTKKTASPFTSSESDRLSEIYRAAAKIICEKGYDATSMNDIAEAVGITKAGIYHHIPGKKELLFQIMNFGLDELDEEVVIPARSVVEAEQRLRVIISNHVRLITNRSTPQGNNPVTIVIEEVTGLRTAHRNKIDQRKRAYLDVVRETLKELKAQEKLRDVDVTTAAFSLLGMILWLARWYNPGGRLTPDEIAEEITKIALGGLLRP